jgi:type II secretory pathway component PulC
MLYIRSYHVSSVNDNPNHFMVLDAISRGMKPVGKLAKVTRLDMVLVAMVINDLVSQRRVVIAEKEKNND